MSQTPLLSIVAAVYNGEKFLAQFFECIEQQQLESYELIPVNDGSTDGSPAVIDEWKARLPHIIVLEQENQGVSVARNTGLAVASGKYRPSRILTISFIPECTARCWRWPKRAALMSPPVTAATFTKPEKISTRFFHRTVCRRPVSCQATSGLNRRWIRASSCT